MKYLVSNNFIGGFPSHCSTYWILLPILMVPSLVGSLCPLPFLLFSSLNNLTGQQLQFIPSTFLRQIYHPPNFSLYLVSVLAILLYLFIYVCPIFLFRTPFPSPVSSTRPLFLSIVLFPKFSPLSGTIFLINCAFVPLKFEEDPA